MNIFKRIIGRLYQKILVVARGLIKIKEPFIVNTEEDLIKYLLDNGYQNILLTTGATVCTKSFYVDLYNILVKSNFNVSVYNKIEKEPRITFLNNAYNEISKMNVDCIIALGGGSTLDASKVLAVMMTNKNQDVRKLRGLLKVRKKPLPLVAIPTTCGSGSEVSVSAVVIDDVNKAKFAINDPKIIPEVAYLNSCFLKELPAHLLAETALDAFTHAIEAYVGQSNNRYTKTKSLNAMKLIFDNVLNAYTNRDDASLDALLIASFDAGCAFTRAYVGYVHAISHALGAHYHVSHGLSNALLLPLVLKEYKKSIHKKIERAKDELGLTKSDPTFELIYRLEKLILSLHLSFDFSVINESDFPSILKHVKKEVYPVYPVPMYLSDESIKNILLSLKQKY